MGNFLLHYIVALVILPIPIGLFWVWIYRNRSSLGLPDWFSGVLAQGVISGHKVSSGDADKTDYRFVIFSTLITTFILVMGFYAVTGAFASKSTSPTATTWYEGMPSSDYANVVASDVEGNWLPAPGYSWVYPDDPNDFSVVWTPGMEHRDFPNIVASDTVDNWLPAPGYRWVDPDDPNSWDVEPDN